MTPPKRTATAGTSSSTTAKPSAGAEGLRGLTRAPRWSQRQAEAHLRSLELFGMRFGLDRMRRMMTVLGSPQQRYECIHVLGTNGKTSTTRMIAAILQRHGLRTAAYTSPHLISYSERLQVGEDDVSSEELAQAIAQAAWAAERVNRTLAGEDHVTQFELLTAAALWQIAERGVQVAVIEAGLGGRYDATSVIEASVTVLTNVGLEHTRWLGPTVHDIAEEKLAVVGAGATLVLGADLDPEARIVAERVARERGARILTATVEQGEARSIGEQAEPSTQGGSRLAARGAFQQRNFALARIAAEAYLERAGVARQEQAVREAGRVTEVRGRLQTVAEDPLTVLDGAHNPDAVRALVQSLPQLLGERPLGLVLGVLEDKDAVAMLQPLLGLCERAWFTAPPSERALSPGALQSLARQLGFEAVSSEPNPERALVEAQRWARERGGAVLATGSVYLVGALLEGLQPAPAAEDLAASRRRSAR